MNEEALCLGCNYPLRGLPANRCPECGRGFDPDDARTINVGRPIPPFVRSWLKPPGWPLNLSVSALALWMLYSFRFPGHDLFDGMIWVCAASLIGAVWFVRLLIYWALRARYRQRMLPRIGLRWATGPGIVGLAILLFELAIPLHVAFWISRPAMQRLADAVMRDPRTVPRTAQVGLYTAEDIQASTEGVRFVVCYNGLFAKDGFAYCPATQPVGPEYRPFHDNWFLYHQSD